MQVSGLFDSGNVEVVDAADAMAVRLRIKPDAGAAAAEFAWFHFVVTGARHQSCRFIIENAGDTRWSPEGWIGYRIVASYDRHDWFRIATTFEADQLSWSHRPEADRIWYAYYAPYPVERHLALLERCATSKRAQVEVVGSSVDRRDLELITVGQPGAGKRACWVIARQHCGETQGQWSAEYLVDRLLDTADPLSNWLLERATFHIVPNMNPDGSARGHHRCNAVGEDLNRAWSIASLERSPEVLCVRERMKQTGMDFLLDLHADERQPYVWPVGTTGIPSLTSRQIELRKTFDDALRKANPDYRPDKPEHMFDIAAGTDPLAMATSWAAETFGCLALIIEFPFLDNADRPEEQFGWSPRRSGLFGAHCLDALAAVVDELRVTV